MRAQSGQSLKSEPGRDLVGQVIDARFRVDGLLGSGGMGVVWRVRDQPSGKSFALKTLRGDAFVNDNALHRFIQEARTTAAIASPHVVRIEHVNADYLHNGLPLPYLVLELLEGESFANYITECGLLDSAQLVWVMRQVARGLEAAHTLGIVHRDLKPSNVFLSLDTSAIPIIKLCDFGNAKIQRFSVPNLTDCSVSTETGVVYGTPRYMAPEQLIRHGSVSTAVDQWAFALIVFRALTGASYFEDARNGAELVLAIVHDAMLPPSTKATAFPAALDEWFLKSCAREPNRRFASIAAQQAALELALGSPTPKPIHPRAQYSIPSADAPQPSSTDFGHTRDARPQRPSRNGAFYGLVFAATAIALLATNSLNAYKLTHLAAPSATPLSQAGFASLDAPPGASSSISAARSAARSVTAVASASLRPVAATTPNGPGASLRVDAAQHKPFGARGARLRPRGASCERSTQCADQLCVAEVCQ